MIKHGLHTPAAYMGDRTTIIIECDKPTIDMSSEN